MEDFSNSGIVKIIKERCIREKFSKSLCSDCQDVCIANAISLSSAGILIEHSLCIRCGLCYAACKFSAIDIRRNDTALIKLSQGEQNIDIGCIFSNSKIKISCVSRLTEGVLINWFMHSKNITIHKGNCKKCKFSKTITFFTNSLKKACILAKSMNIKPTLKIKTDKSSAVHIPKDLISRRNLLNVIKSKKEKPKRVMLAQEISGKIEKDIVYPDIALISISNECNLCGICEHICPVNAIFIDKKERSASLYFNPSLCINCLECQRACTHQAISFQKHSTVLFNKKPYEAFTAKKKICTVCKKEFFSNDNGSICPLCSQKKARSKDLMDFFKEI